MLTARSARTGVAGFTILEVVVALSIMLAIAAVVSPGLVGYLDRARVDTAETSLGNLADAIVQFGDDTGERPGSLTQLSTPITTSHRNVCGAAFSPGSVGKWGGPYVNRDVTAAGLPIGIGTAMNQLVRDPAAGSHSTLRIVVTDVEVEDAVALNDRVDGDASAETGSVRWSAPDSRGLVALHYVIPIRGC